MNRIYWMVSGRISIPSILPILSKKTALQFGGPRKS